MGRKILGRKTSGRKTWSIVALAAVVAAAPPAAAQTRDPVRIGAIEVLTGPNNRYGIAIQRGFDLALEDVNRTGVLGGRPLAIAYEDSAGNKEQALNAARKLIGRDRVPLILGPTLSNEMFAAGPVANERKVPIVGTSTTAAGITAIGPYVFRTSLPEADVIPVTIRRAKEVFGIKRVAVMYGNDDAFTKSGYDVFRDALAKAGIETLTTETFGGKDSDFSAQLTKIKAMNPDAIVVSALVEAAAGIALQARQLGIDPKVFLIGGNGFNSPKLGAIAGTAADGTLVGSPWFASKTDQANRDFVAAFKARYGGDEPDQFAAQAYDTLRIVAKAIEAAGAVDSQKIRDALAKTTHSGVMGPFSFSEGRDPADTSGVVVLVMRNGRFEELK